LLGSAGSGSDQARFAIVTEHDHKTLVTERAGGQHTRRLAAFLPSDPGVVAVMRLAAAALVAAFVLWVLR
jgi:hypothetical protein